MINLPTLLRTGLARVRLPANMTWINDLDQHSGCLRSPDIP